MSDEIPRIAQIEREADEDDNAAVENAHGDLELEAPEADSAEQRTDLLQHRDEPATSWPADRDGEANPADTAEQRRVVEMDEDEDEGRR
ncbi:hypothetical protein [Streptomyces sp. NRRL F-5123]|uniref:hypothetical protein n=1 Tax=Streptomyces sp. NRRL F-5123 TaxID=1463856 RepID=UPI0004E245A6|nr:hypothetical protein [Streptomyces sp. NRRL F-5123]